MILETLAGIAVAVAAGSDTVDADEPASAPTPARKEGLLSRIFNR